MPENSTHNQILLSIYGELECCDDVKFKNELVTNAELADEYRELKQCVSMLQQHLVSPKSSTEKNILRLSKRKEKEMV